MRHVEESARGCGDGDGGWSPRLRVVRIPRGPAPGGAVFPIARAACPRSEIAPPSWANGPSRSAPSTEAWSVAELAGRPTEPKPHVPQSSVRWHMKTHVVRDSDLAKSRTRCPMIASSSRCVARIARRRPRPRASWLRCSRARLTRTAPAPPGHEARTQCMSPLRRRIGVCVSMLPVAMRISRLCRRV